MFNDLNGGVSADNGVDQGYGTAIGDEGGFAHSLKSNVETVKVILQATIQAPAEMVSSCGISL